METLLLKSPLPAWQRPYLSRKIMAYNKFTLEEVVAKFGLQLSLCKSVVPDAVPHAASQFLLTTLRKGVPQALQNSTEKARSEFIVAPILLEIKDIVPGPISFFSGVDFTVDKKLGLSGRCDFIISRQNEPSYLTAPVVTVVEAKNDNLKAGLGQCVAEMVAAQLFNQRRGQRVGAIYGVVTTGVLWRFLKLEGSQIWLEEIERAVDFEQNLDQLLGAFVNMLESRD